MYQPDFLRIAQRFSLESFAARVNLVKCFMMGGVEWQLYLGVSISTARCCNILFWDSHSCPQVSKKTLEAWCGVQIGIGWLIVFLFGLFLLLLSRGMWLLQLPLATVSHRLEK